MDPLASAIIGAVVGVVLGAVVIYIARGQQVANYMAAVQNLRAKLGRAHSERDLRVRSMAAQLKQDYDTQLDGAQSTNQGLQRTIRELQQKLLQTETITDRLRHDYKTKINDAIDETQSATLDLRQKLTLTESERDRLRQNYTEQQALVHDLKLKLMQTEVERDRLRRDYEAHLVLARTAKRPAEDELTDGAAPVVPQTPAVSNGEVDLVESASEPDESVLTAIPSAGATSPAIVSPSASSSAVPQLPDIAVMKSGSYAPDASVRCQVVEAITSVLTTVGATNQAQWMPTLERLVTDESPEVRLQAIQALSQVKSVRSVPLLRRALRDSNPSVVKAANAAISRFKEHPYPSQPRTEQPLPKNR